MKKLYLLLYILFMILTFIAVGYVFYTGVQVNGIIAIFPAIMAIVFNQMYRKEKKKDK